MIFYAKFVLTFSLKNDIRITTNILLRCPYVNYIYRKYQRLSSNSYNTRD